MTTPTITTLRKTCRNGALALSLLFVGLPTAHAAGATGPAGTNVQETTAPAPATPVATTTTQGGGWGWIGLFGLLGLAGLTGRGRGGERNVVVDGTKR
jgi:hypothetical protein